ncbi:MAG: hypothetical protein HKUEN02_06150 [Anaerolineaceae bacterium]|nr:MAG: hypothetical protein HKUEN02_06150 [Anaerolineaceae bacterium]
MNTENNTPIDPNDGADQPPASDQNNAPFELAGNNGKPKWLTRKEYTNPAEKKRDFWIGVAIFFVLNIVLTLCQWGLGAGFYTVSPSIVDSNFPSSPLFSILSWALLLMPWVINIALVIYFALTRSQIALGMVAGFGIALAIVICLGVIFTVWCFVALSGSGF